MARYTAGPTPKTRQCLVDMIGQYFGSQRELATRAKLNEGSVSRLIAERNPRPATPTIVGKIVATLPPRQSVELMTAFLADTAAMAANGYEVTVKRKVA
ncbi:MAG TPA: hypothetical protein VHE81_19845 [Lacipirellulaceae bacterium]|nr:hypothetical protein [Lacipirellulaceae bacterium]